MLVVLPVHHTDVHLTVRSINYAHTLEGKVDFTCLIVHEKGVDIAALIEACQLFFASVNTHEIDPWKGDSAWPHGANWIWQATCRYVAQTPTLKQPWLWLEPDAIPIKAGWLTTLADAHQQGGRLFSGPITTQTTVGAYMAGVAIYPPDTINHCYNALLARTHPWDVIASTRDRILNKCHDISTLIHHLPTVSSIHFSCASDLAQIPDSAVVFHKCKDGSLLDVLQGVVEPDDSLATSAAPLSVYATVPSFTEQTEWPSGYFTFPTSTNTAYFNPSVIAHNSNLYLFTRRERYNLEQISGGALRGRKNDLAIWQIRSNFSLYPNPILPSVPSRYPHEQWEDPRAMLGDDGRIYIGFATWVHYKQWSIRQSLTRLSQDWRRIDVVAEPAYGGNSPKPVEGALHEKNWIWFQHASSWHCQYSLNPGEVFSIDSASGRVSESWKTKEARHSWACGLPLRGGTPLTRVGNEYIGFFHSSTVWQKPRRRYFMGAYAISAEPPFGLTRLSSNPILVGSEQDFRALGGPLVIFPGGAILRDSEWLVVFGVNDEACGWIKMPHTYIDSILQPVKRGILERITAAIT